MGVGKSGVSTRYRIALAESTNERSQHIFRKIGFAVGLPGFVSVRLLVQRGGEGPEGPGSINPLHTGCSKAPVPAITRAGTAHL